MRLRTVPPVHQAGYPEAGIRSKTIGDPADKPYGNGVLWFEIDEVNA
jgi:hypothetical protein